MLNLPGKPYAAEDSLLHIYQINLDNSDKIIFAFMYHMNIPGSELEHWPYWLYEKHVEMLNDVLQKKQNAENKAYKDTEAYKGNHDPNRMASGLLKQATSSLPKAPTMPNPGSFRMPKL